jgi:uncharacterized protein (DUF362 family)
MTMPGEKKGFERRRFLGSAASIAALAALAPGCFLNQRGADEWVHIRRRMKSEGGGPEPLPATRIYPAMPRAVVSAVGVSGTIEAAVREAVEAAGGLKEIERGQRVMIKPNMCGPAIRDRIPGRITTNPEVIRAVVRLVKERGATAMVGDRSMLMTEDAFIYTGFAKVCREEGAVPFPWTRSEYVRFFPKKRHWSQGFRVPKILTQVDHFINVPLLKNHGVKGAEFTCCLKSFVGVCMPLDRHQEGPDALHTHNISEKVAELNLSFKPLINIVDATEIMVRGGPDGMKKELSVWARPNLILASKDRVACDSLAVAVLKRYGAEAKVDMPYLHKGVWDQVQIYYAAELGIGQADPAQITLENIRAPLFDEIKANWA